MEQDCFAYCFGSSAQIILDLFRNYSEDSSIELTFTKLESDIFSNPSNGYDNFIFKEEFFSKILTSFASFKRKERHSNINNGMQIEGERTIDISVYKFEADNGNSGIAKNSISTPINYRLEFDTPNILYIRHLSMTMNIADWEISKIIRVWSDKINHKRITWKYDINDVINETVYDAKYYRFKYNGLCKNIVESFINVINILFPKLFRTFDKNWFEINQIVNISEIEPTIEKFKAISYTDDKYEKFKMNDDLSTIIEYNHNIFKLEDDQFKLIGTKRNAKPNEINVYKCIGDKVLSVLHGNKSTKRKGTKLSDSNHGFVLKNLDKNELIVYPEDKTINFMCINGYLYLRGYKDEIISRDSIVNQLSIKHIGYSLLDVSIKNDQEILVLFYLPFNHKPIIKNFNYTGPIKCRLEGGEYVFVSQTNVVDTYRDGLDIACANFSKMCDPPRYIKPNKEPFTAYQFIYEKYLNKIANLKILYVIDEECLQDIQYIKVLCDIKSLFIVGDDKKLVCQLIKNISNARHVDMPTLVDLSTKIWQNNTVDISYLKNIENIFNFTNFTISCINAVICFGHVKDNLNKIYKSIFSDNCIIITNDVDPFISFAEIDDDTYDEFVTMKMI